MGEEGAAVHTGVHEHYRDACSVVSSQDGSGNWGGAAPAREQRRMDVEYPAGGDVQDALPEDLAVGGHYNDIR